jgi:hypothetical protein
MFKKLVPEKLDVLEILGILPHCDGRVLHAPGECSYCDKHPDWQALRQLWGIAFTGYEPDDKELPDPATAARGFKIVNAWGGNQAKKGK